jgi:YfiH family protein
MIITPNWPAPNNVHALTTLRGFGNLAMHVEDDPAIVAQNRARLMKDLPSDPYWLNQFHSDVVVNLDIDTTTINADGSYTSKANVVCAVLTADCLPILLCDKNGEEIAALHAGWKGILADIITQGVSQFNHPTSELMAPKPLKSGRKCLMHLLQFTPIIEPLLFRAQNPIIII